MPIFKLTGDAHIAFNVLTKQNETSLFYHGKDKDIAMLLAITAYSDERFRKILNMAYHLEITSLNS